MAAVKRLSILCLFVWVKAWHVVFAQTTPFVGTWSFEDTDNGSSSNALVSVSTVSYAGVNKFGPNPYTAGYVGKAVNVQNWSTTLCNQTEYIQFSVQPTGTATITLTTLSFAFSRSASGPQQLSVRSSADGFGSDIFSQSTATTYQTASITLSNPGFSNQSGPVTFRIYACNPTSGGATIHLDEIQLNGSALPVTLLSFTAKAEGDRGQLAWATTSEREASRFVVERSLDLQEYVSVGEVAAKGTTTERQYYGLTDLNPHPGINYYRLKQIDLNGAVHLFTTLVSATIETKEPVVTPYPNPTSPDRIHLRLWNADDARIQVLNATGQPIPGRLERQPGEADWVPEQPLLPGLYMLVVDIKGEKQACRVLVR